jgi:hypothetical protein
MVSGLLLCAVLYGLYHNYDLACCLLFNHTNSIFFMVLIVQLLQLVVLATLAGLDLFKGLCLLRDVGTLHCLWTNTIPTPNSSSD